MAICKRVAARLDERGVRYEIVPHFTAFTAQDVAHAAHVSGTRLAKVLLVREGQDDYFLVVLPAQEHLDFGVLRRIAGRRDLALAAESEMRRLFPDCDAGAIPPFGALYELPMYVDPCLRQPGEIWFQAGNHGELVRTSFAGFETAAGPFTGEFCLHASHVPLSV